MVFGQLNLFQGYKEEFLMQEKFNLIILGPQGCGKGTQANLLAEKFDMTIIAPGELVREKTKEKTSIAKKIQGYVEKGELVPNEIIGDLIFQRLKETKKDRIIFDGFPRDFQQTQLLEEFLKKFQIKKPIVIYLKIARKTAIARIASRRICPKCKDNFYPKSAGYKEGICPKCQTKIIQRSDDKPKVTQKRLEIYFNQTEKIIDYYRKQNRLIEVDGEPEIKQVFHQILARLHRLCETLRAGEIK